MSFYKSENYKKDIEIAVKATVGLEKLYNSSVLIAGGSGLIGSFMADMLLFANKHMNANITVYAMDLSAERLATRYEGIDTDKLHFVEHNVNELPDFDFAVDYIIHAASPAFPAAFNNDPVGTVMSNILGTKYLLDYGKDHGTKRMLYISSGEVYGQGDLSLEAFEETYAGYVDPTSARSCYPNGKRTAETLCVSYTKQFGIDTVIVRPSHTYGPTVTKADNRANAQFVNKGLAGEDIVLNSAGNQMRSYTYLADSASAILSVLTSGESGNAYNIANSASITTIAGFAKEVASQTGTKVIFADPDEVAKAEMTPIAKQVLSSKKLEGLGWKGQFTVEEGIRHTLNIMREL
ncbi:NAD-dependent epimerase/dehydratase family protein [Ruminococcus sp.]|uniref:NAD-dependent epimerase/dehydratase family protein n=1 Tax=Ruminococcus sp. TaxID=41978 RepID=UPI0025FF66A9|nr:NAD-dependent epimerase/dehydratase family protein [Ruminococcus sp.]